MKPRSLIVLLTSLSMILCSCGKKPEPTPEPEPEPIVIPDPEPQPQPTPVVNHYTVTFYSEGQLLDTQSVEEGQKAVYSGQTPTKPADGDVYKYLFRGWDKDIDAAITEDTRFNAVFGAYYEEVLIDDFESYDDSASMIDEGWTPLVYSNSSGRWTDETAVSVSLGSRALHGEKCLRFDSYENGVGYKIAKIFDSVNYSRGVNAFKFGFMAPSMNTFKVLLHANVVADNKPVSISFTYTIKLQSSEYMEYVIPLGSDDWAAWGNAQSIKELAGWINLHQDDFISKMTRIEFYLEGNDKANGSPYVAFLDDVKFVTLDDPQFSATEVMGKFDTYTGKTASQNTVEVKLLENNAATVKVLDAQTPTQINGTYAIEDKDITFTSADNGETLVYKGRLVNGGQSVKYISVSGSLKTTVGAMNMNAVQTLDDYEQYDTDGVAYYSGNPDVNARSGCRGAYYGEYWKGEGSTPWGGTGWSILEGNGDQLKLVHDATEAHSGNNCVSMKNSQYNGIRYMQWGLYDGSSQKNSYRGTTFSFWAKTIGVVPAFKVSCYSQTSPKNATKDNYVKTLVVEPSDHAIDNWTHYEIQLDEKAVYYGFLVFMEHNYLADSYLLIDDVQIYTDSPFATYQAA